MRNGNGSLHVMIAGFGRRASILNRGGSPSSIGDAGSTFLKPTNRPFFRGIAARPLVNWCWRRAYDSCLVCEGLGGSMGKNLKSAIWSVLYQASRQRAVLITYRSAVLLPQLWPHHSDLNKVFNLRFSGKTIQ